ncbi:ABC transporter ATP-binding protein [Salinicola halimionae]|uniref:ABC transporter ATP-binding protein n=1 Tax=Salinicola halimionae TaxID=1949081 RepID=UPI000DA14502|nr:ABC transporter ATP-binding protein [Salinicola halimionae]
MAEIRLEQLAHSYHSAPSEPADYALRRMEHVWEQGGAYALLGPSGCGKSTLLNIISGLLTPSEGRVLYDGKSVNDLTPQQRNIAQVFQFPVVYDTMTVFQNLAFPLRNQGHSRERIDLRVREVAEALEIEPLLNRKAQNLTADEKQKVSMGRGLVRDDVAAILFDEPLTVIDPQLKWRLRRKLKEIHQRFNVTMVYVTHDQLEASTFADKIAVMYQGQIVQFGTPRELFENPQHTFVGYFIGSPGMNFLDISLGTSGVEFEGRALAVADTIVTQLRQVKAERLQIGIRPEFVQLVTPENAILHGHVDLIQDQGTFKIVDVCLDTPSARVIKVRIGEEQVVPEGRVGLSFPAAWQRFYVDDRLVEGTHENL